MRVSSFPADLGHFDVSHLDCEAIFGCNPPARAQPIAPPPFSKAAKQKSQLELYRLVHLLVFRLALEDPRLPAIAWNCGLATVLHDRAVIADHLQEPVFGGGPAHPDPDTAPLTELRGRNTGG